MELEKFRMKRSSIHMEDRQIRVFNGRGWVCPQEYSVTGFIEPNFGILHSFYGFRFDFQDKSSKEIIWDDVPSTWEQWVNKGEGTDPLGANFRKGFKKLLITQDEYWEPGKYSTFGIFNNKIKDRIINFSIKSEILTSSFDDSVFIKIKIKNNSNQDLNLNVLPRHLNTRKKILIEANSVNETVSNGEVNIKLYSSLESSQKKYFDLFLSPFEEKTFYTKLLFFKDNNVIEEKIDFKAQFNEVNSDREKRLEWFFDKLPKFSSENKNLWKLYYHSVLTMNECKWTRDDFILNPFWSVGSWLFTIAWDTQFSKEVLGLLDPKSLLDAVRIPFLNGNLEQSYISWEKPMKKSMGWTIFYIQEPISVMKLIKTYLKYTNDTKCLNEIINGKSIVEWFKSWSKKIELYLNEDYLIDVKDNTEILVEIRTKGYDHIVPNVNILCSQFMEDLSELCGLVGDLQGKGKYEELSQKIISSVLKNLWDEDNWWFSNLYSDGSKMNIYAYHLFDSIGTKVLPYEKKMKLISHINESEFLGKYGFFSISKRDKLHYDRIDADWGGGGQFAGMPGRIAHNVFKLGNSHLGFKILKKLARWTNVFPYQPQNARTEQPFIDLSSMAIQLSSGSSIEAIIFGIFGIDFNNNQISINPKIDEEIGETSLENLSIKGHEISIFLSKDNYKIIFDNKEFKEFYGVKKKIDLKTLTIDDV